MIKKIVIWDFDQTLVSTPTPEVGVPVYEAKTGNKWPHRGWWGRRESLDMDIFDVQVIEKSHKIYQDALVEPDVLMVMMTGRIKHLSKQVEAILESKNLKFDRYIYNTSGSTLEYKLKTMGELLKEFDTATEMLILEDRIEHIFEFEKFGKTLDGVEFNVIAI